MISLKAKPGRKDIVAHQLVMGKGGSGGGGALFFLRAANEAQRKRAFGLDFFGSAMTG